MRRFLEGLQGQEVSRGTLPDKNARPRVAGHQKRARQERQAEVLVHVVRRPNREEEEQAHVRAALRGRLSDLPGGPKDLKQVDLDLPRTFPEHPEFFRHG